MRFLTKTDSSSFKVLPAVAAGVTATSPKMQLGQEEERIWHCAHRMVDGICCVAPVNGYPLAFKYQITGEITVGGLVVVIWHEGEQAVWVLVTVKKLDEAIVGGEALVAFPCRDWSRDDPQEDVITHEAVHWPCVTTVAVHSHTKVVLRVGAMWRDQCVILFMLVAMLQLKKNSFFLGEKGIHDSLGIWPGGESAREERKTTTGYGHLAVHNHGKAVG